LGLDGEAVHGASGKPNGVSRGTGVVFREACLAATLFRWKPNGVSRGTGVVFREACLAETLFRSKPNGVSRGTGVV